MSLQPTGPPTQGPGQHTHARLNESFDNIRQEFEVLTSDMGLLRNQRDEYESKVTSQINELNIIRQSLYELESQHGKIRQQYEEELSRLRAELHAARQGLPGGAPPHQTVGPELSDLQVPLRDHPLFQAFNRPLALLRIPTLIIHVSGTGTVIVIVRGTKIGNGLNATESGS